MNERTPWTRFRDEVNEKVDYESLYTKYGVEIAGTPNAAGWVPAHSHEMFGGRDNNPSASINLRTGYYKDFRSERPAMHLFKFLEFVGEFETAEDAERHVYKEYGIKQPSISKKHPSYGVQFQPWESAQCKTFLRNKIGITEEGLKKAGAMMCNWHDKPAFVFPVYDNNLMVVGWHFIQRNGQPFRTKGGSAKSITKTFQGADSGFIGTPAVEWLGNQIGSRILETEERRDKDVYWFEGVPDMLAAYSYFINGIYVSNPHGAQQSVSQAQAQLLTGSNVRDIYLVADADEPGVSGAFKRSKELENIIGKDVLVRCPGDYEIKKDRGRDWRDYVIENIVEKSKDGIGYLGDDLYKHLSEQISPEKLEELEKHKKKNDERSRKLAINRSIEILDSCGLAVVSRKMPNRATLYSKETHHTMNEKISNLKYEDVLLFAGHKFKNKVSRHDKDRGDRQVSFSQFQQNISLAAQEAPEELEDKAGAGIWSLRDEDHELTGELIIVQKGECYILKGSTLTRARWPVFEHFMVDMACKERWFDASVLSDLLPRATEEKWRQDVYKEFHGIVSSWNWSHQDMDIVACGMFLATWIQTLWKWRPIVTLTGQSSSGKTMFLEFLEELFLGLANLSGNSTAAGVKQAIGMSAAPFLLDEFDTRSGEQEKLLQAFRVASRGQQTLQGTSDQSGKRYKIRHIPWISGIFASSDREADLNRMIELSMNKSKLKGFEFKTPDTPGQSRSLGYKLLAGVLVTANRAIEMAQELAKREEMQSVSQRYRESYSVPFAAAGAFVGMDIDSTAKIMQEYLEGVVLKNLDHLDVKTDQDDLLMEILAAKVTLGTDAPRRTATVAEILFQDEFELFRDELGPLGVGVVNSWKTNSRRVVFCCKQISGKNGLLEGNNQWASNPGLKQVLARLDENLDPRCQKQRIHGVVRACVTVDYDPLKEWVEQEGVGNKGA